jgi:hypothetical protein
MMTMSEESQELHASDLFRKQKTEQEARTKWKK